MKTTSRLMNKMHPLKVSMPSAVLIQVRLSTEREKIMSGDPFLEGVEARLSAVSSVRWEVIELDRGQLGVEVIFADGHRTVMRRYYDCMNEGGPLP